MKCRFCETELIHTFADLGTCPPSNSFLTKKQLSEPENYYPLKIHVCHSCFLVQTDEYKSATEIFDSDYAYFSSYSASWLQHASEYVDNIVTRFGFNNKNFVSEIASNDGYLLQYFVEKGIPVLGIEPTSNTAKVAHGKGVNTLVEYFGKELALSLKSEGKQADLLLGNNVLAHVPNINDFVAGLKIFLAEDGLITMEFPHLLQLIENKQFDTIYHEHFSYLSFSTVLKIFEHHGLTMFDVEEIPTHGGSLRIYARHSECDLHDILPSVALLLQKEQDAGLLAMDGYTGFQEKVDEIKSNFIEFLKNAKSADKTVIGYGAAAKGNTLINYSRVDSEYIGFIVDASPHKQGKHTPGSRIPVVSEENLVAAKPDYVVILPWNLKEEISTQLSYIKDWGGQFVIAIPEIEIS